MHKSASLILAAMLAGATATSGAAQSSPASPPRESGKRLAGPALGEKRCSRPGRAPFWRQAGNHLGHASCRRRSGHGRAGAVHQHRRPAGALPGQGHDRSAYRRGRQDLRHPVRAGFAAGLERAFPDDGRRRAQRHGRPAWGPVAAGMTRRWRAASRSWRTTAATPAPCGTAASAPTSAPRSTSPRAACRR